MINQGGFMKYVLMIAIALISNTLYAQEVYYSRTSSNTSSAQGVAEIQARNCRMSHMGGNTGYEGVGYSSRSADDAVKNCCYWGQRKPLEIGVAKGRNGWYACVRYR
jgi:hypothetical protein